MQGVIPVTKRGGCLPRITKPGQWCPLFGSSIKVIPKNQWKDYSQQISLKPFVRNVYNQKQVGSCFPSGTLIRLSNGTEKPIEDIRVLDEVVTAEGNAHIVTQTMVRKHEGEIVRLLINGSHHVRCTPEHPILTERGYVAASELQKNDMVAFPKYAGQNTSFIQTLDYVCSIKHTGKRQKMVTSCGNYSHSVSGKVAGTYTKHPLPDIIHLTYGFGRIIGLFLAEGCVSYGKSTYTFNINEEDTLVAELLLLLKQELGVDAAIQKRNQKSTIKVNIHGTQWSYLFEALCGKLAKGKILTDELCDGPKEFLRGVLTGWCDGDGIAPGRNGGTTISKMMAMQMFDIANFFDCQPTIRVKFPKLSHGVKSRQPVWTVEWGTGTLKQKTDYRKHQDNKHVWRRVEGIEVEQYNDYVFNLEVEQDHSYVANGIGVHNCASESTNQSVAIGMAKAGLLDVLFNPYGMYHFVNGGRDQGSSIDANLKFAREFGCFPESVWPRSNGWQRKPSEEAMEAAKLYRILEFYDIQSIEEFVTALLMGFPVVYGANGHAVCAIQHLENKQAPMIVNSWSTDWEDNGFGVWVNYASLRKNLSYGAFAVRTTTQNQPLFNLSV
jgi:hypothetical protein